METANSGAVHGPWTSSRLSFAAGCFHFSLKGPYGVGETLSDYGRLLKEALDACPAIYDAEVELLDEDDTTIEGPSDEIVSDLSEGYPFPFASFLWIEFELSIPSSIQAALRKKTGSGETGTERFKIYMCNEYDAPVSIIVPLGVSSDTQPSNSVSVVREFLSNEFNSRNERIKFESLGPSPIHADFELIGKAFAGEALTATCNRQTGYMAVEIVADTAYYESLEEAFTDVRSTLGEELDVYYQIVEGETRERRSWQKLEQLLSPLVSRASPQGVSARLKLVWNRSRILEAAHSGLLSFEANSMQLRQYTDLNAKKHYADSSIHYIRPLVDDKLQDRTIYPSEQFAKLISFAEQRRSKAFELFVVLMASLIGGIAGAVLTSLSQAVMD